MKIGYGRVSTDKQDAKAQEAELLKYGCEKIFLETVSGASTVKPVLAKAIEHLRPGDELVVWKLDRLSRSLGDLLIVVDKISATKAVFGKIVGRPPKLDPDQKKEVVRLLKAGQTTQAQIARTVKVNRSVISRLVSQIRLEEELSRRPEA